MKNMNLNENEAKVLSAICAGCDDLDGWGFNRPSMMMVDLVHAFEGTENWGQVIGAYLKDLIDKGVIEFDAHEDEVWVDPEVYATYR